MRELNTIQKREKLKAILLSFPAFVESLLDYRYNI